MSATRSLEISAETAAQEREQKREEAAAAYTAGALAYHEAIRYISDEPAKEAAARELFNTGNPYPMVAYGDDGHQRPQWFAGLNDAMAALYGVQTPLWTLKQGQGNRPPELYGTNSQTNERIASYEEAVECAVRLSAQQRATYWAEDRGAHVSPRYAVIRAFSVGEPVSYGFNGDSYPCGRITKMSKTGRAGEGPRIITVQEAGGRWFKFWRRRLSGSWKKDGTWSLQHGWHNDRNPSF